MQLMEQRRRKNRGMPGKGCQLKTLPRRGPEGKTGNSQSSSTHLQQSCLALLNMPTCSACPGRWQPGSLPGQAGMGVGRGIARILKATTGKPEARQRMQMVCVPTQTRSWPRRLGPSEAAAPAQPNRNKHRRGGCRGKGQLYPLRHGAGMGLERQDFCNPKLGKHFSPPQAFTSTFSTPAPETVQTAPKSPSHAPAKHSFLPFLPKLLRLLLGG